jgi:predicted ArsR family transcriptional regulator
VGEQGIPQEIKAFIAEHIDSVMQLEVLLLLLKEPQRSFSGGDLARELRIDPAWANNQLIDLAARGLLVQDAAGAGGGGAEGVEPKYRYQTRTPELHRAVTGLAQEYADRRVSVISLIFSKPVDKIRSFADAFRIRKD